MFKRDRQKNISRLQRIKTTQSKKKKLIKTREELGTTDCLGCKDYTHNFKPQVVKITNKAREKNQTVLFVDLINQDFQKLNNKK